MTAELKQQMKAHRKWLSGTFSVDPSRTRMTAAERAKDRADQVRGDAVLDKWEADYKAEHGGLGREEYVRTLAQA